MTSEKSHYSRRPPRLERIAPQLRPFYFVTFNTSHRRQLLACEEVHDAVRTFCLRAQTRGVGVGRYVLMPDHAHLFVVMPSEGITLAEWIRALRTVIGKRLLLLGHEKPHWQEGFFDHLMRSRESYSAKWDYVRMNPVRAGLCQSAEEWPFQGEILALNF